MLPLLKMSACALLGCLVLLPGCKSGGGSGSSPPSQPLEPLLGIVPDPVSIQLNEQSGSVPRTITLQNPDTTPVDWLAETDAPWLSVSPDSGTLTSGDQNLTLLIDTDQLDAMIQEYPATITVTQAGGAVTVVDVTVDVYATATRLIQITNDGGRLAWYRGAAHQLVAFDAVAC